MEKKKATETEPRDKTPPMNANDFYLSAKERFNEAAFLYDKQVSDEEQNFWVMITFLSVIAVECMLTAYLIVEEPKEKIVKSHDLGRLLKKTSLNEIEGVRVPVTELSKYWSFWRQDLRYLHQSYAIWRIRKKLPNSAHDILALEEIGKITYSASFTILQAGEMIMESKIAEIINFLMAKYGKESIRKEYGGPMKVVIHIEYDGFVGISEEDRQADVWDYLHSKFKYKDLKFVGFIMTWTPDEYEIYSTEFGHAGDSAIK